MKIIKNILKKKKRKMKMKVVMKNSMERMEFSVMI